MKYRSKAQAEDMKPPGRQTSVSYHSQHCSLTELGLKAHIVGDLVREASDKPTETIQR